MATTRERRGADPVELGSQHHYEDAPLYDYEYRRRRRDVQFYRALATEHFDGPGEILELCCGTGRVTAELCRAGHRVVGLDRSRAMLARAQARLSRLGRAARPRAQLACADMCQFAFSRRFGLVLMTFNSFEHLYTRVEVAACLERVRAHLAPGGRFAFDVQLPDLRWLERDPRKRWARTKFRHPVTGQRLEYSTNHDYDPVSQIVCIRLFYEPLEPGPVTRTEVVHLSQRKFFPAELEALLAHSGFSIERRFGDFDGEALGPDAESQVLVCQVR